MRAVRLVLAALALVGLSSCGEEPEAARPALWEVSGPGGSQGWLFGTIHALPRPVTWRSPRIDAALTRADRFVLEIDPGQDQAAMNREFAALARTPGQPPLAQRIVPRLRPRLAALLASAGRNERDFAETETWAVALTLARLDAGDSTHGVDRAVAKLAGGRPVIELEGTRGQLRLFDSLPEKEQRDLLAAVVAELQAQGQSPADAWRRGDMAAIERETRRGMLADPELRAVLFTARNRAWTERIAAMLSAGKRPFVAVGGAHMAGEEGLPAMLAAKGYTVRRVQ